MTVRWQFTVNRETGASQTFMFEQISVKSATAWRVFETLVPTLKTVNVDRHASVTIGWW
jgi:hypothetical protein